MTTKKQFLFISDFLLFRKMQRCDGCGGLENNKSPGEILAIFSCSQWKRINKADGRFKELNIGEFNNFPWINILWVLEGHSKG